MRLAWLKRFAARPDQYKIEPTGDDQAEYERQYEQRQRHRQGYTGCSLTPSSEGNGWVQLTAKTRGL